MRTAGVAFILLALTALWLYNTGRLETVLAVIKDPSFRPGKTQFVAGLGSIPASRSSTYALGNIGGVGTPPIAGDDFGNIIGQIFGTLDTLDNA